MTGTIIFVCALCLAVAMVLLSIPKNYVCGLCGKQFRFRVSLNDHIKFGHPEFFGQNPDYSSIVCPKTAQKEKTK